MAEQHIEALNEATKNIPAEQMRLHLCWGNYEGPHHLDIAMQRHRRHRAEGRRANAISFEGANPRHAHEWAVWKDNKLPDDKVLMPGVIDTTTNFIEHPELVAQRILRYAERRRARARDRGRRLRLRHQRGVDDGRPAHRVGEAQGAG